MLLSSNLTALRSIAEGSAEGSAEDTVFAKPTEDTRHFQFKCNYSFK